MSSFQGRVRNRGILLCVYKQNISSLTIIRAFINQHLAIYSYESQKFNVSLYTHYAEMKALGDVKCNRHCHFPGIMTVAKAVKCIAKC